MTVEYYFFFVKIKNKRTKLDMYLLLEIANDRLVWHLCFFFVF